MFNLLSRKEFKERVFARDNYKCIICGKEAIDAHHILDRKLFKDGGYYLENGASLCEDCHLQSENSVISCEELRKIINIDKYPTPDYLFSNRETDKWGKAMGHIRYKFPRTFHLPWSPGSTNDDKFLESTEQFIGKEIVVTLKVDGENTNIYPDYLHARSTDYVYHESREWVKALAGRIQHLIPKGWRVCGENLYATHSIHYKNLPSYFMMFSIWDDLNNCLSWDETVEWSQLLEVDIVPTLYRGIWNEDILKNLYKTEYEGNEMEGFVGRIVEKFKYEEYKYKCFKYVRKSHIKTDEHWKNSKIIPNELCRI